MSVYARSAGQSPMQFLVFTPPVFSFAALVWAGYLMARTKEQRALRLIVPGSLVFIANVYLSVAYWEHGAGPLFQANLIFAVLWSGAVFAMGNIITTLANTRRSLNAGETRAEAFRDSIVDGVIMIDAVGVIQSANPAAERLFGYEQAEIIGRNVNVLMPEPYRSEHDGYLQQYMQTGRRRIIGIGREVEGRRKDGGTFPCYLSVSEFIIENKRFFTGIVHDLSELHQERNFISAVLNVAGALVVVMDRDGRILRFNRACARITGYTLQEVRDRFVWDVLIPSENVDAVRDLFHEIRDGDYPRAHENEWLTREGERRLIEWSNTALADEQGRVQYVIATGIDITEKRKAENEIRRLSRGIIEVQEEERNRIAREIHDTLGQSLIALKFQIRDIDYRNAGNEALKQDCDRVTEYINDIARESRELSHSLSPISMRNLGLVEAVREMARTFQAGHGIDVESDLEAMSGFFSEDWNTDVYRMIQEALINACKHADAREIKISAALQGDVLRVKVADDGLGLKGEAEELDGLGLRIMRERASHLGAGFKIESSDGKGTEVIFEFRK